MIKLVLALILVTLAASQPYRAIDNFDASEVLNKGLYLNGILSTMSLNLTMDNFQPYCTGYLLSPQKEGNILSQFVMLTNYTSYTTTYDVDDQKESVWKAQSPKQIFQWTSFGTFLNFETWTWAFQDLLNEYYIVIAESEGADVALLLSAYWQPRFTALSKLERAAIYAGFPSQHFGYYFTQCSSYTFDRYRNPYYSSLAAESTPAPADSKGQSDPIIPEEAADNGEA